MLNIYSGREDVDKQRWMFARIKRQDLDAERKRFIYLIVPDQFTLETERSAFMYMDAPAFMNPTVLSMNRLAGKVLAEAGERPEYIDRYGNYMLLARLLYRNKKNLGLFRDLEHSTKFIAQLSAAILSLKSHMVAPAKLLECAEAAEEDGAGGALLGKKLRDVATLYKEYEARLAAGTPDGADITRRFAELIPESKLLSDAIIWIFGFDYFSPLHLKSIGAMAARAAEVNVVLTAEPDNPFFSLTNGMAEELEKAARIAGAEAAFSSVRKDAAKRGVDCSYLPEDEKPPEIAHIEQSLFVGPMRPFTPTVGPDCFAPSDCTRASALPLHAESRISAPEATYVPPLRFVAAQNYYHEAEAAAHAVLRLVREGGLRYRDILVVCNDQERRAAAIRRVFSSYGIESFLDKRHDAGYNPVLAYITALPEIISRGYRAEDVMRWIGTGLTDISEADAEELENYTARYALRGAAWLRPLTHGAKAYDDETFKRIEDAAGYVGGMMGKFAERFGQGGGPASAKTALARTKGLLAFLEEDARIPEKIAVYADRLEAEGLLEYAARMRGIWDAALGIFAQIGVAFGDVRTSVEEYATILRVGFASVMIGVLPASSDCVTIGTMQRTRTGRVKAMFVLGANDGELPMFTEDDGLLDDDEKETLERLGLTAFRREENLHREEQLAIYKNLSKPTRLLWLSYTGFGADGKDKTEPSRIFERLRALFPDIRLEKASENIPGRREGRSLQGGAAHGPKGPSFEESRTLGPDRMSALIPPVLSATSIEKYSRCPFSFLMDKGLKLGELRKHEVDGRIMGEVYHEALRRFGEVMNTKGGPPKEEGSAWNTASREDTDATVEEIFHGMENPAEPSAVSEEGALLFDKNDPAAVYRLGRLRSIVKDICRALTDRAADSGAERLIFETKFGDEGGFDLIRLGAGPGKSLGIDGRIDRIDVLPGGRAKVIDYKSGNETFNGADVKSGWQLQLMLYLKAIEGSYDPAGVSYFRLFEPSIDLSDPNAPKTPEEIREAALTEYRSDGVTLPDEQGDADVSEKPKKPAKRTRAGERILPREEFDELRAAADKRLAEIAAGLAGGEVPAAPKKAGGDRVTACTWCNYKSICNFEA